MSDAEDEPVRDRWHELPEAVRRAVADALSAPVASAVSQRGGFSHGMAAVLNLLDGRRVFAKAVRCEDDLAVAYHREAATAGSLSGLVPTPAVLFTVQEHG